MTKMHEDLLPEQKWWFNHYLMYNFMSRLGNIVFLESYLPRDMETRKMVAQVFTKKYLKRNPMRNPLVRWWMANEWISLLKLYWKNARQKPCPFMKTHEIYGLVDEDFFVLEQIFINDCIVDFFDRRIPFAILAFCVIEGVSAIGIIGFFLVKAYSVAALIIIVISLLAGLMHILFKIEKKYRKENDEMAAFLFNTLEVTKSPLWWLMQDVEGNS